jgi:hypothetical protein
MGMTPLCSKALVVENLGYVLDLNSLLGKHVVEGLISTNTVL